MYVLKICNDQIVKYYWICHFQNN